MFGLLRDLFAPRGFQKPPRDRGRGLRDSTRIRTMNAVHYQGFCAGRQETARRKRQIVAGQLQPTR